MCGVTEESVRFRSCQTLGFMSRQLIFNIRQTTSIQGEVSTFMDTSPWVTSPGERPTAYIIRSMKLSSKTSVQLADIVVKQDQCI